jgi:hypothetical protein
VQVQGGGLGKRRLAIALDGCAAFGEFAFEAVQEDVASGFGNVEQPDCESVDRFRSRDAFLDNDGLLTGRVEEHPSGFRYCVRGQD